MERTGRRYRTGRAAEHYDTVVIGSGIGGLANAALLAKLGQRVCVLEQHYTAGGFTHSYDRNGYEWDVGVHYIGEMQRARSPLRRIFDVISDGALQWAPMDPAYDRILVGGRSYDFIAGSKNFRAELKRKFPEEAKAIDRYVDLVYRIALAAPRFFFGQGLPPGLARVYNRVRRWLVPKETLLPVRTVLEGLTGNQELIGVLTGQWGDYGLPPAQAPFLMHATVVKHYFDGGSYPVGGSWKIADTIIPVIRAAGGEVFTYARVREILIEDGRATGVVLENGDRIGATSVVSSVGARLTFGQLLPEAERSRHGYAEKLGKVRPSAATLCLFLGFKGSARELGLPKTNLWIYPTPHHEQNLQRHLDQPDTDFPLLYISFPSAKDPQWDTHYPGKSTVQVITVAPYEWFERWRGTTWNQRGADYDAYKQQLTQRLLRELYRQMPQLEAALDYCELATPLSTEWFHLYDRGEIYGLDHDAQRFRQDWLHPVTPIPGLYQTGQDVVTAGVGGALIAGVLTTAAMLGRKQWKLWRLLGRGAGAPREQWADPAAARAGGG